MRALARWFVVASLSLSFAGCPQEAKPPPRAPEHARAVRPAPPPDDYSKWQLSTNGVGFRVSNAEPDAPVAQATIVTPEPLDAERTKAITDRMSPLAEDSQIAPPPNKSIAPPTTGASSAEPFPPAPTAIDSPPPVAPQAGALTVLRRAPEGAVANASGVAITFSQPMVALGALGELPKPIATLSPQPHGAWSWVSPDTLAFRSDRAFPKATDFSVEIPSGTRSATGAALSAPVRFSFSTPAPTVVASEPRGTEESTDPPIAITMDQAIDPPALATSIELAPRDGGGPIALRLATKEELDAITTRRARAWSNASSDDSARTVQLRAQRPLAEGTAYRVRVKKGAPSAEGPRRSEKEHTFEFTTHGALAVTGVGCNSRRNEPCRPLDWIEVGFTNGLDLDAFDPSLVKIEPDIALKSVTVSSGGISVHGHTKGRTKYAITVSGKLKDRWGGVLGKDVRVEVDIGDAEPQLFGDGIPMRILEPIAKRELSIYSVNEPKLHVQLYAVTPADYPAYTEYVPNSKDEKPHKLPGKLVFDRVIATKAAPDEIAHTKVDLAPALTKQDGAFVGHVITVVEPARPPPKGKLFEPVIQWLQATTLGIVSATDSRAVTAWTTRLLDGSPIEGVDVSILGGGTARTGKDGVARVPLVTAGGSLIIAKKGADSTFASSAFDANVYTLPESESRVHLFAFDDLGLYRPGEEVHVKGILRRIVPFGDVTRDASLPGKRLQWNVLAEGGSPLKGEATIDDSGAVDFAFRVPADYPSGEPTLQMKIANGPTVDDGELSFQVQEYRRPDFDTRIDLLTRDTLFVGGHATAAIHANYYAGGGVGGATATWMLGRRTVTFVPPGRGGFHFGPDAPRAIPTSIDDAVSDASTPWRGVTDTVGMHTVRLDLDALEPAYPYAVLFMGSVADASHQEQSAFAQALVHPASFYVGLDTATSVMKKGAPIPVAAIVTDLDGRAIAGRHVMMTIAQIAWKQEHGSWVEHAEPSGECAIESAAEPVSCTLSSKDAGEYRIDAIVTDDFGRKNQSTTRIWVTDGGAPSDRHVQDNEITLVPAKQKLASGEAADVLVVAPFAPAEGLYSVRRDGVIHVERFTMTTPMTTLHVPMPEGMLPSATVHVDLVGVRARENDDGIEDPSLPKRPAFATGSIAIEVSTATRTLDVKVTPRATELAPGSKTEIAIDVRDPRGQPIENARVAVVAADEAVLALTNWRRPDPIAAFYPGRQEGVYDTASIPDLWLSPDVDIELKSASAIDPRPPPPPSYSPGKKGVITISEISIVGREQIHMREHFASLALFAPRVVTDANGHATVAIALPDDLTRFRITAVAAAGENWFGSGESAITSALPLSARIDAPRFATHGDAFEVPVLVQNRTNAPLDVGIVMRAKGATITSTPAVRARVRANERVAVPFSMTTASGSTARLQVAVESGTLSDASEIAFSVKTPQTLESFASYGVLDEEARKMPLAPPFSALRDVGGLEVSLSSTAVSSLTDAFIYADRYPYECNEQLASRILSTAALYDVLSSFHAKGIPPKEELDRAMNDILHTLRSRQDENGGWGFWRNDRNAYVTLHVIHALLRARARGWNPPPAEMEGAMGALASIESTIPKSFGADARRTIVAYSLYLQRLRKNPSAARARKLIAEAGGVDKLSLDAIGWIWPTLSEDKDSHAENDAIRAYVSNHVRETAQSAHFAIDKSDADAILLRSDHRADGILLEAMIADQPKNTLIPKLARGLLEHRTRGHWASTHENAFALLALGRYFEVYEKASPAFEARAFVGGALASAHTFDGRTTETASTLVPMSFLVDNTGDAVVTKQGAGRLYYRLAMTYAPSGAAPPPIDRGFVVSRAYEGIDDASDVTRDVNGVWRVKVGARVRVRVSLVTPEERHHVALVDPLPAGFEAVNGVLAGQALAAVDPSATAFSWFGRWYDEDELKDDRAQAFATQLPPGVHDYTYIARATAIGTFTARPPKAEEMYAPETFGRGKTERVIVE